MEKKKRFIKNETFRKYLIPTIVSVIISTLTTLAANALGLE